MIYSFILFFVLAMQLVQAKTPPAKKKIYTPPADCKVMADSMQKLYDAGDPSYLTWDISPKCDSSIQYQAYYYQGIGFYLLSDWKESLYFLNRAKEIGGTKDEEILFHLWNVNLKHDRFQEMERATFELHRRYPNSSFLMEILDKWKTVKVPSKSWNFGYTSKFTTASRIYFDNIFSNRLRAANSQKAGSHSFRELGSLTVDMDVKTKKLKAFQTDLGMNYEHLGFSLDANYGAGFNPPAANTALISTGFGVDNILTDTNWNWYQGHVGMGYDFTTKGGWSLGAKVDAIQLSKSWREVGISHTESYLFKNWFLFGYLDYQIHFVKLNLGKNLTDSTQEDYFDGMRSFTANLTPFFSWPHQTLGVGATYSFLTTHTGGGSDITSIDHTYTGTLSYSYDILKNLKTNVGASYGFETKDKAPGDWIYSADLGLTYSF